MRWIDRLFARIHRRGSNADKVVQEDKVSNKRDKEVLERRLKRIEATAKSYGLDLPKKESS